MKRPPRDDQLLLTIDQAGERCGLTGRTIRRYIAEGRLKAHRIGPRLIRIDPADLKAMYETIPTVGSFSD